MYVGSNFFQTALGNHESITGNVPIVLYIQ